MNFLDYSGLQRFLDRLKAIIPTKTSDIQNDSGYLDTTGVQNYMENGGGILNLI